MMTTSVAPVSAGAFVRTPAQSKAARRSVVRNASSEPTANPGVKDQSVLEYAKTLPGISEPFPNIFDPADLLGRANAGARPIQELRRWREAEITHGRVSMLAALGFIVQEQLEDFPAFINFDGHVTGPAITQFQQVEARGAVFWEPLVFAIGLAEAYRVSLGWATPTSSNFNTLRDDYEMGNLGFDPLGLCPTDPKERYDMQTKELNNGRLAMVAIAAFVGQELVEKDEIFEHLFKNVEEEVVSGKIL